MRRKILWNIGQGICKLADWIDIFGCWILRQSWK